MKLLAGTAAFGSASRFVAAFEAPFPSEVPASKSGISFIHSAGTSAEKYLPESTGSGCAFLDYDNDGWMDIYLVNSGNATSTRPRARCATRSTTIIGTALSPT